jgi:hypothetical protein
LYWGTISARFLAAVSVPDPVVVGRGRSRESAVVLDPKLGGAGGVEKGTGRVHALGVLLERGVEARARVVGRGRVLAARASVGAEYGTDHVAQICTFGTLAARARLNSSGDNETGFLDTLDEIVASGKVPAQRLLDAYNGEWNGDITRVYEQSF